MTRVIQWATGITGMMSLRHVLTRPDLELAGVSVYDTEKAGVDAGTLCGLPEAGIPLALTGIPCATWDSHDGGDKRCQS